MEPRTRKSGENFPASNTSRTSNPWSWTEIFHCTGPCCRQVGGCGEERAALVARGQTLLEMAREVHRLDQQPHRGAQEGRLQDLRDGRLSLQGGWGGPHASSTFEQANAANSECRDRRNLSKKLPGSRFDRQRSVQADWRVLVCPSLKATSAPRQADSSFASAFLLHRKCKECKFGKDRAHIQHMHSAGQRYALHAPHLVFQHYPVQ